MNPYRASPFRSTHVGHDLGTYGNTVPFQSGAAQLVDRARIERKINDTPAKDIKNSGDGHQYILDHKNSRIIFIPYGDATKAQLIKLEVKGNKQWNPSGNKLEQMARIFCATYASIESQQNKLADDGKPYNFHCYVIDVKKKMVRGIIDYTKHNPSNINSGAKIKIDESVWQDIDDIIHNRRNDGEEGLSSGSHKKKGMEKRTEIEDIDLELDDDDESSSCSSSTTSRVEELDD